MRRLYYTDSLLTSFDAVVESCATVDGHVHVTLDQTAFYPTSGGQPFDRGVLGGAAIVDVLDDEETGSIVHVVDRPLTPGTTVHGEVDWPRRLDHMQQHTGQHVLSAAFDRRFGVRTVSFHMGAGTATIDLAREVTPVEIAAAERDANAVVWDDRPVAVRYASDAEAAAMPLRKESTRTGTLRLVEVPDWDLSACGGTHVVRTGTIGMIAIGGWERFKGGTRVTFLCGGRALAAFGALRDVTTPASRVLTVAVSDLPDTITRMQTYIKDQQRAVRDLQEQVTSQLAVELRATAVPGLDGARVVVRAQPGWDGGAIKHLAAAIVSSPGFVVVLTGEGTPVPVVVARSADVGVDAGAWIKEAAAELGGKGGGRPEIAQGGLAAGTDGILARASRTLIATAT